MSQETPTSITGGCLCENIRYEITFPPNHDFKNNISTCQCSQCRKQSGSLMMRAHQIPLTALSYSQGSAEGTGKPSEYNASKDGARGFCPSCGSFLYWREVKGDRVSVCVGTFDRDVLRKWGTVLTKAGRHLFCEDEVVGVTDHLEGERWQQDSD